MMILTIILLIIRTTTSFACMEFSNYSIEKNLNFLGSRIDIAIKNTDIKDFIIELQGPLKSYKATKKRVNLGVWLDSERFEMHNVPSMYFVGYSSNEPIAKHLYNKTVYDIVQQTARTNFSDTFLQFFQQHNEKAKLFSLLKLDEHNPNIIVPKNAPLGSYNIILYDVTDGKIIRTCQKKFIIQRNDFLEKLYILSREYNILYTIFVVIAAIFTSIVTNKLMRRKR